MHLCSIAPTTVAANTAKRPGRMLKQEHSPLDQLCSLALTSDAPPSTKLHHHTLEPLFRLVAGQATFDATIGARWRQSMTRLIAQSVQIRCWSRDSLDKSIDSRQCQGLPRLMLQSVHQMLKPRHFLLCLVLSISALSAIDSPSASPPAH